MEHEDPRISIAREHAIFGIPHHNMFFSTELWKNYMSRNNTHATLLDGLKELHTKKNHDYADDGNPYSNFEYAASIVKDFVRPIDQVFAGIIGIKLARLGQLLGRDKTPNNESVVDTMRDLTNYCAIWASREIDEKRDTGLGGMDFSTSPDTQTIKPEVESNIKHALAIIQSHLDNSSPGELVPLTRGELLAFKASIINVPDESVTPYQTQQEASQKE